MTAFAFLDVHAVDMTTQEPGEFVAVLAVGVVGAVLAEDFAALDRESTACWPDVDVGYVVARHDEGVRFVVCGLAEVVMYLV